MCKLFEIILQYLINITGWIKLRKGEKTMKSDLNFSLRYMFEMMRRINFRGFTADICGKCWKTANVPAYHGWHCSCGHFNALAFSERWIPHLQPMYKVTRAILTLDWLYHKLRGRSTFMFQFTPLYLYMKRV